MNRRAKSCIYVGAERGVDGDVLRHYYALVYSQGALNELPWKDEQFDCVICVCNPTLGRVLAEEVAREIVLCNVDYVQTTGVDAEQFHDLIDAERETTDRHFGEEVIMTTWHEDVITISEMADLAYLCFGGADYVLLLVIGNDIDLGGVIDEMRRFLSK